MSEAEARREREEVRRSWLLSLPALALLAVAAIGPLFIMVAYSFLTPGKYGNVERIFSLDGWSGILSSKDIFSAGVIHAGSCRSRSSAMAAISSALSASDEKNCAAMMM